MPGCLGLDAMWQLVGFFLGWLGGLGQGRALGVGEVKFTGQVLETTKKITYQIKIKRVIMRKLVMGIADGIMKVDGRPIYEAKDMRVGLFTSQEGLCRRFHAARRGHWAGQIGRASCREGECQYVERLVVAVSLKTK